MRYETKLHRFQKDKAMVIDMAKITKLIKKNKREPSSDTKGLNTLISNNPSSTQSGPANDSCDVNNSSENTKDNEISETNLNNYHKLNTPSKTFSSCKDSSPSFSSKDSCKPLFDEYDLKDPFIDTAEEQIIPLRKVYKLIENSKYKKLLSNIPKLRTSGTNPEDSDKTNYTSNEEDEVSSSEDEFYVCSEVRAAFGTEKREKNLKSSISVKDESQRKFIKNSKSKMEHLQEQLHKAIQEFKELVTKNNENGSLFSDKSKFPAVLKHLFLRIVIMKTNAMFNRIKVKIKKINIFNIYSNPKNELFDFAISEISNLIKNNLLLPYEPTKLKKLVAKVFEPHLRMYLMQELIQPELELLLLKNRKNKDHKREYILQLVYASEITKTPTPQLSLVDLLSIAKKTINNNPQLINSKLNYNKYFDELLLQPNATGASSGSAESPHESTNSPIPLLGNKFNETTLPFHKIETPSKSPKLMSGSIKKLLN